MSHGDEAIVVALGSNLAGAYGSSRILLEAALEALEADNLHLVAHSDWWRSAAWPDSSLPDYLNGVAIVETPLSAGRVLDRLLAIEVRFGRRRGLPNDARTLDLDLIAHGRTVIAEPHLVLPHPRASERRFVMGPLAQIAPKWVHPVSGLTAEALAEQAGVGRDATPCR